MDLKFDIYLIILLNILKQIIIIVYFVNLNANL